MADAPPPTRSFGDDGVGTVVLIEDGERRLRRRRRRGAVGEAATSLVVELVSEQPSPEAVRRLGHEYALAGELDPAWALRPLELLHEGGRRGMVLDDPGGEPLEAILLDGPLEASLFLRLAIQMTAALAGAHAAGLVHKDIKPAHVLVNCSDGRARLTGFGIASRLPRERQPPAPPEFIAGTLAYMAPEQTGRMNRSIDARSDLYSLGVTFYRMLTGHLPFTAGDAMEWVHCHIARQPLPPMVKRRSVPATLSGMVMKLLAKESDERYQTAAGLAFDLRRGNDDWSATGWVGEFPLGERDVPHRLLMPEKLYGRERDVRTLHGAFDRVVASARVELVLVSGYSGIGKSSVVNELHRALVPPRGWFAAGKADQYRRDIPYSTFAQAFHALIRSLLSKSGAELSRWKGLALDALESDGRLVTELMPDLGIVIGEQPPVAVLDARQAKGRFHRVLRRFVGVFATAEHPLALFLDDLQWADQATLELLEDLLAHPETRHLLVVGAYRDNEVDMHHGLRRTVEAIGASGTRVSELRLGPLALEHVAQLTSDALRFTTGDVAELASLVHAKTDGNPFFVLQFLQSLADAQMLVPGASFEGWSWDIQRIRSQAYAGNVGRLMADKLTRLPASTQSALRTLACLGNAAQAKTLALVLGVGEDDLHAVLWAAVRAELIKRSAHEYRFVHDRVQEAAYAAVEPAARQAMHLHIGRLLEAELAERQGSEAIFEVVNHLNRGSALLDASSERRHLAELNLLAGKRAKDSAAHASALQYFSAGLALLPVDAFDTHHTLAFALERHAAESDFLLGATVEAAARLDRLSGQARHGLDKADVACLQMDVYVNLDRLDDAIRVGLAYLRQVGVELPARPAEAQARLEFEHTQRRLDSISPASLPAMTDPQALAALNVYVRIMGSAHYIDPKLAVLATCRAVALCIDEGNGDAACIAYLFLSSTAGRYGHLEAARRFGDIGHELVEMSRPRRFLARAYVDFASLSWVRHVRVCTDIARRAFDMGNQTGDLLYATHACWVIASNRLASGDPLPEVQQEIEWGLTVAQKARFGFVVGILKAQLGLVRTLRGLTARFGAFEDEQCNDLGIDGPFSANPSLARVECWYWVRKLEARYLAGDLAQALHAASRAHPLLWTCASNIEAAEYHFFTALALATSAGEAPEPGVLASLTEHHRKLSEWLSGCPANVQDRVALVAAEIARVAGREREAMDLYERAIELAAAGGFIQIEALANELAARFYAERGIQKAADAYLSDARYGYLRWGADGKVQQLVERHPFLRPSATLLDKGGTIGTSVQQLDMSAVFRAFQTVSSEIVLEKLIDSLMHIAMEHAGAQRGLLVLAHGDGFRIEAEAVTDSDAVAVRLQSAELLGVEFAQSVFLYATRTRETVLLRDALTDPQFGFDPYIRERRSRSILCLPLINQSRLVGVLYLENALGSDVFTPSRTSMLTLLASGAAISLENGRLYRDLQEREARVRRLFSANIIGIFIWDLDGKILDANEAFLKIVGYDADDLRAGQMLWRNLMPADWDESNDQRMSEMLATGVAQPFESEYVRKDGRHVPVYIGAALFGSLAAEGVAFVLDISDRKRAEQSARDSIQRYHDVQMRLDDANRVASIAELSASIAHELSQPIAGILTNASTCLRMLSAEQPNTRGAGETARRTIRDAKRAAEVIARLRALFGKKPGALEPIDLNEVAREAVALSANAMQRQCVQVRLDLALDLPQVLGDRLQLQQVILNLLRNAVQAMHGVEDRTRQLALMTQVDAGRHVLLAVSDNGEGIAPERMSLLFEAFYTTKADGMGIGLSVSRAIIERHAGRLWASQNEDYGATFSFYLPLNEGDDAVAAATVSSA